MRNIFGWWYPPGAASDPNAPWNQTESPCMVCGKTVDDCICPECPVCKTVGDPTCYDGAIQCSWCGTRPPDAKIGPNDCAGCRVAHNLSHTQKPSHGMNRTPEQIASLAEAEARWQAEAEAENR